MVSRNNQSLACVSTAVMLRLLTRYKSNRPLRHSPFKGLRRDYVRSSESGLAPCNTLWGLGSSVFRFLVSRSASRRR